MSLRWTRATEGLRWRVFDAKGEVLGRLASRIAVVLMGKDKPTYTPNRDDGDVCIVLNARSISLTGNKLTDKVYRWHTGYIGHLKERTVKEQMARKPEEVIRKAVLRMLPRNKLQDDRARKLRIFSDDVHPFADKPLSPYVMPPRKIHSSDGIRGCLKPTTIELKLTSGSHLRQEQDPGYPLKLGGKFSGEGKEKGAEAVQTEHDLETEQDLDSEPEDDVVIE